VHKNINRLLYKTFWLECVAALLRHYSPLPYPLLTQVTRSRSCSPLKIFKRIIHNLLIIKNFVIYTVITLYFRNPPLHPRYQTAKLP
jgi:hypothetical protein